MRNAFIVKFCCLLTIVATNCSTRSSYERIDDGVIIHISQKGGAKNLKLQVVSDKIIHVTTSPVDTFPTSNSLMVVPDLKKSGDWDIIEGDSILTLQTRQLQARVSLRTGEVAFLDSIGNEILQEQKGGGKYFIPTTSEGESSYSIRQVFESPEDEAFYGLGGHQNGQMNYKGQDVELVQHNIVDVVPFLYSSRNYGILWDNYSISNFGDARAYQPLSTLQLFDLNGNPGGLTAKYFVKEKVVKEKVEDKIDFEYLETPQLDSFPKDVAQNGKIVWEGSFASDKEGAHKFLVYASGYFKVWVDNNLILDKWRQNWNPWTNKFTVDVKPGEKHSLKIEWITQGGFLAVKHLDPISSVDQDKLSLSSELGDEINYYFIKGDNADDVISGYRLITGKAPIVPKWAMGFWQSRERYRTQQEILDAVKEYRKRNIPLDNIVLDWQYWRDPEWGSHEFDTTRFPDAEKMVKELHDDLHANIMISVWPKFNKGTEHYEEMRENGFLFMRNIEKKRKDWVGPGFESTFYDPFNPKAGALFWKQIDEHLNSKGIDGWWLDATEPDMHSNLSIEERKLNMSPTHLGSGAKFFNAYSLVNSKSVYEGSRKSSPEKRVFILTRSAFAGQQRYGAVTWSGDIVSRWSDFQDQIATGINFSLSGIPYWTMDIGGFAVENRYYDAKGETLNEWRELNTRWFQFGAFCPIFRSHGQYPFREIYNIAAENHEAYQSMVYYDKLRYKLMPYIYSLAGKCFFDDYTIMRGLVMDYNDDEKVHDIADQYMFGPSILVNPVYTYKARTREVYLPASSGWYDLYRGKFFEGGQVLTVEAPYERMPLFIREGSIIPTGPAIQYTSEQTSGHTTLWVFTGANATFDLYEDEGVNYNYEQGKYSRIPLVYNGEKKTLTIGNREGEFDGMLKDRTFNIVWVSPDHAIGLDAMVKPAKIIEYSGKEISISEE